MLMEAMARNLDDEQHADSCAPVRAPERQPSLAEIGWRSSAQAVALSMGMVSASTMAGPPTVGRGRWQRLSTRPPDLMRLYKTLRSREAAETELCQMLGRAKG